MRVLATIWVALIFWFAHAMPIVLSNEDIGDHYDQPPEDLRAATSWLGLFTTQGTPADQPGQSRLAAARVRFVKSSDPAGGWELKTTPPNATFLISGVRNVVPGPAITVMQSELLDKEKPELQMRLGQRLYTLRLVSHDPEQCDAMISLTSDAVTQTLFDVRKKLPVGCDGPHFTIHWAGDLDRDGRLDLLVTFSEKYSYFPNQLLLSSAARATALVAEVARYERLAQ
jgi:hypothetical protein